MTVTWTTWVPTRSEVQFGRQPSGPLVLRAQGTSNIFVDGGVLRRKFYMHRVTLRGLQPGAQYGEGPTRAIWGGGMRTGRWLKKGIGEVPQAALLYP